MPGMRLIHLPMAATVLLNIAAWLVIHLGTALAAARVPLQQFDPTGPGFRPWQWERLGHVYVRYFWVNLWKKHLPDGAPILGMWGFPKKHLERKDSAYIETFSGETCRAELTHWIILAFAPIFFLWNRPIVGLLMIIYAAAENLPLIIAQRYNRFRLLRLLAAMNNRNAG